MQPSTPKASGRPMSLAEYVVALGDGSVCFCCGGQMKSPKASSSAARSLGIEVIVVCTTCGSEVDIAEEDAESGALPSEARAALVAAA